MQRKGDKKRGGEKIKAAVGRGETEMQREKDRQKEKQIQREGGRKMSIETE